MDAGHVSENALYVERSSETKVFSYQFLTSDFFQKNWFSWCKKYGTCKGFRNPENFACGIGNPSVLNPEYVVPENIHTPLTEGNWNSEGRGDPKDAISVGMGGGFLRSFSCWFRVRLVSYQKLIAALLGKLSVILLLTSFKTRIFVFIDDILFKFGKLGIQYLESGVHSVESRIQDCLGFPSMVHLRYLLNWEKR